VPRSAINEARTPGPPSSGRVGTGGSPNTAVRARACLCSYRVCATSPLAGVTSAGPAFPGSGFGGSSRPLSGPRRPEMRRSQTRLHRSGAPFLAGGSGLIRRLQSRQSGGASRALRAELPRLRASSWAIRRRSWVTWFRSLPIFQREYRSTATTKMLTTSAASCMAGTYHGCANATGMPAMTSSRFVASLPDTVTSACPLRITVLVVAS
jgi:hypothetical protein